MTAKSILALAAAVALSACQVTVNVPETVPGQTIPGQPIPGQPGLSPSTAELRTACARQASAQGLRTLEVGRFQTVTNSRGVEFGVAAPITVARGNQPLALVCTYTYADRTVRLGQPNTGGGGAIIGAPRPSTAEMRNACTRSAQSQDLGVVRIGEFRTVTGSRGVEVGTTAVMTVVRNSQVFDLRCNYSFADRQVRLTAV
jgi:hypothetical protein